MIGNMAESVMPSSTMIGSQGAYCNALKNYYITGVHYTVVDHDAFDLGQPYCKEATLSSLPGFILLREPEDLKMSVTTEERQMIVTEIKGGFFNE